jgi:hypothetical protein
MYESNLNDTRFQISIFKSFWEKSVYILKANPLINRMGSFEFRASHSLGFLYKENV